MSPQPPRPGDSLIFAMVVTAALACTIVTSCGCSSPTAPTAVTAEPAKPVPTSQVLTWPDGLTLDHDPTAPGISVCRTKLRGYADGDLVSWMIDYYTVAAPERCPAEPIE